MATKRKTSRGDDDNDADDMNLACNQARAINGALSTIELFVDIHPTQYWSAFPSDAMRNLNIERIRKSIRLLQAPETEHDRR